MTRGQQRRAHGVVCHCILGAKAQRGLYSLIASSNFPLRLQHGGKVVMRLEIWWDLFPRHVARQRLLQHHAGIALRGVVIYGQNLQPEVAHFVAGTIASFHANRRMVRVQRIPSAELS